MSSTHCNLACWHSQGLNQFLGGVAFPAFVFHGLATMDLSSLSWSVYSAILVSKIVPVRALLPALLTPHAPSMYCQLHHCPVHGSIFGGK